MFDKNAHNFVIFLPIEIKKHMEAHRQMENQNLYQFFNFFAQLVQKLIFWDFFQIFLSWPNQVWLGWLLVMLLFSQSLTENDKLLLLGTVVSLYSGLLFNRY